MDHVPISYVRHSMAVPDPDRHPTEWELDDRGRAEAERLADRLEVAPEIGVLVSSTEPKALGTAEVIAAVWGAAVRPDERLREARRPWVGPGYRAVAHRYLRGEPIDGWEPHADVSARTEAAVEEACDAADRRPVVVVTHGLVLAVHLRTKLGGGFDAESFWSCLAFPDAWALDSSGLLHRPLAQLDSRHIDVLARE
jgi:broad specificity phosphatase PhoE